MSTYLRSNPEQYPITAEVETQLRESGVSLERMSRSQAFLIEQLGEYEHGSADLPAGLTLEQYARVVEDLVFGLEYGFTPRAKAILRFHDAVAGVQDQPLVAKYLSIAEFDVSLDGYSNTDLDAISSFLEELKQLDEQGS